MFLKCLAAIAAASLAFSVSAQPAAPYQPPTIEEIWKNPTLMGLTLSRSGKYIAASAPHKGRLNLLVIDVATWKGTRLTAFDDYDVMDIHWVGDERLIYSVGQLNAPTGSEQVDGGGLFVVDRDGKNARTLSPTVKDAGIQGQMRYRGLGYARSIPGSTDEIIAAGNLTSADAIDLYRLDLTTGRTTLLTSGRPSSLTSGWLLDSKLVPRVVTAGVKDELTAVVFYRKAADAPWEEIARFSRDKGEVFVPLAIDADDQTLQVATNRGRDTMAVFKYDPATKSLGEQLAAHPRFDMGADSQGMRVPGVRTDPETRKLIGFTVDGDRPETVWIDEQYAKTQAALDAVLKDRINSFSRTPDGKRFLVASSSDVASPRWYFFDPEKRTMEEIGAAKPWLDGKLVQQRSMRFKTRDGLEIPGYLFLPRDYKEGTKLPTIVYIHGGPAVRADRLGSGFGTAEGQLFASRGYAVVVPNFRITPGFGQKIYQAGFGTVGRQMSEDHEDATKWAVEQGFADPKRLCISGASYGGYAALQAMVKTPDLFKCAIAGLAVTDMYYQQTTSVTDFFGVSTVDQFWRKLVGVKDWKDPIVAQISPVNHASKIKGSVFLYAGKNDRRVPINQIDRMAEALTKAGNPPKAYIAKDQEGHGFGRLDNRVELYTEILKFLEAEIGK